MSLRVKLQKKLEGFALDVAFEIGAEIGVIFGYSGAGKSLTLRMIAGLLEPDGGSIEANGNILYDGEKRLTVSPQRRRIGYVVQGASLFPHFTVAQNIRYGLRDVDEKRGEEALLRMAADFQIVDLLDKYPREISGGQQQRVVFARALIGEPVALLLDEPFSALDNPIRARMRNFLKQVQREFRIPVVLVTHDVFEAYSLADRLLVYSAGKVVQAGTPADVFGNPANPNVKALVNVDDICRCTLFKRTLPGESSGPAGTPSD